MELLFLYIESFRSLEKLSFNFSYDHTINFDEDAKQLSITYRQKVLNNFFGEQITNVSAIIGRNSSGKSSVLELLTYLTKGSGSRAGNYLMVFKTNNKNKSLSYKCYTNILGITTDNSDATILDENQSLKDLSVIFFSNVIDGQSHNFPKEVIDLSQNKYQRPFERRSDYYLQLKFILSEQFDLIGFETPRSLILSLRDNSWNTNKYQSLEHYFPDLPKEVLMYIRPKSIKNSRELKQAFRAWLFVTLLNEFSGRYGTFRRVFDESTQYNDLSINDLRGLIKRVFSANQGKYLHDVLAIFITELFNSIEEAGNTKRKDIETLLNFDDLVELTNPERFEEKLSGRRRFLIRLTPKNQQYLKKFATVFDHPDLVDVSWSGVSSGQLAFLNLFSQLHSTIKRVSQHENVLLLIDEGDLYLHPQWQQDFLNKLLSFLPLVYRKKNIQLILTSHSPFLATDLPRQNIVLLERNFEGRSRVILPQDSIERTFGANLYDLYEGSFFLDNGSISSFALKWIQKAIAISQNENASKEEIAKAKEITGMIGEELIRYKLEKTLADVENR